MSCVTDTLVVTAARGRNGHHNWPAVEQNVIPTEEDGPKWITAINHWNQELEIQREERRMQHDRRMDRLQNLMRGLDDEDEEVD
ncbi:hypothetical protein PG996_005214 [Apiospora saccharicola]|uniref:Uncharacterized protein n=1 Tax=Apiospora saccharicola TaxID=335842 RepID=A0ABR1VKW2_9PEZI